MTYNRIRAALIGLACGAIPLVTAANCESAMSSFGFYRDDDEDGYYDSGYYDDGYYADEVYYYDDCYYECYKGK